MEKLRFLYTQGGFVLDRQEGEFSKEVMTWIKRFNDDRYQALYDLGFKEKPAWLDASGSFLYRLTDRFQKELTRQPDLELVREKLDIQPDDDMFQKR